ncbi:hypothetical protein [uncultured Victivallis sp.]|uniref:hypothetical protein n=1 Tax=uncultured Victivallis sp. TaxID=354118 RepID=UPI0025CE976E|nr:hypothetical protein [uncultured Victivallis sp.]
MDNEELKGTKIAIHDIVKTFIKLDDFDMTEDKGIKAKEEILRIIPNIARDDFVDGKFEYYLGLIYAYRRIAIEAGIFSNELANAIISTRRNPPAEMCYCFGEEIYNFNWKDLDNLIDTAYKFSGRKKDKFRQKVRGLALKQKQELLQKGKSNTEANTIVIYQLERHPIYGNYVKDLGKEALRKLLQIPKTPKEKNGK